MRRWLCLFMLMILPLQLSWAVAASYCQHEQGADVRHYGHHQHEHQPGHQHPHQHAPQPQESPDDASHADKAAVDKALTTTDSDCAACHLGALQPVPLALNTPLVEHPHTLVPHTAQGHASHIPEGLERPAITLAA